MQDVIDIPKTSIIVFSERCELKSIFYDKGKYIICKRDQLLDILESTYHQPDILNDVQIDEIYYHLKQYSHQTEIEKKEHIMRLKEKNIKVIKSANDKI